MRYVSSGHSHGEQITVILEGVPSNLIINLSEINQELKRRQQGYGRGGRMKIEQDQVEIIGGVLFGKTTGAPLTLIIKNKDYKNHETIMNPFEPTLQHYQPITIPRPGHADLVGAMKYQVRDMKVILERSSARETVSRVAVGAICKQILKQVDIHIYSYVLNIGGIEIDESEIDLTYLKESEVRMPHANKSLEAMKLIDQIKLEQDSLGGIIRVIAENVPAGLGSFVTSSSKLDAKIASSMLSIQSCKAVEFGLGFKISSLKGSQVHDIITYCDGFKRDTNHYGGFEGGMTTGMPIVVQAAFKPIPTLMKPLPSVDINTKEMKPSHIERSDVCVIPSASVICEHTLAFELVSQLCEEFTSHTMDQLIQSVHTYREALKRY